ncbi:hypothetical protein BDBG_18040, partial [Blastomyces gilchristii SLH14081]
IELLEVTVPRIKLFPGSSSNDHMRSYATVLIERGDGVTTAVGEAQKELDTDELTSRRDDISLQGTATTTTAAREAGEGEEGEGMTMRAVLPRSVNTAVFIFN